MSSLRSPIELKEIPSDQLQTCSNKCTYKFDYGISDCKVRNQGDHLSLTFNSSNSDVTYNGANCSVQEVRLYKPSLNNYYGTKVDAELIINHSVGGGDNLVVCVPIRGSNAKSKSSTMMEPIIRLAPIDEAEGQHSVNVPNYSLNNVIPAAPFYTYKGSLPYDGQNGTYNILIFDSSSPNANTNILTKSLETLGTIIEPSSYSSADDYDVKKIYYNKNGTGEQITGDDIYIDCQPVDGNGEIIAQGGSAQQEVSGSSDIDWKELFENPYFGTVLGLGGALIIAYYVMKYLKNK